MCHKLMITHTMIVVIIIRIYLEFIQILYRHVEESFARQ